MSIWEKLFIGLIGLAFVAVVVGSEQTAPAIEAIGKFVRDLTTNVVGMGRTNGGS